MTNVTLLFDFDKPEAMGKDYASVVDIAIKDVGSRLTDRVVKELKEKSIANRYGTALKFTFDRNNPDLNNYSSNREMLLDSANGITFDMTNRSYRYRLIIVMEDEHQSSIYNFKFSGTGNDSLDFCGTPCVFYEKGNEPIIDNNLGYPSHINKYEYNSKEEWAKPFWRALANFWGYSEIPGMEMPC